MKKYLPLLAIILVLSGVAVWVVTHPSKKTINETEGNFAVKEPKEISKIVLTDTENKKVELTQAAGVWMVNGKYPAREELIKQLLDAVTRVTSLCPVPTAAHDNVIREMVGRHIQAQIFDADNNLLKSYWVGGPTVDAQNTYMLLEIDGKPASRPHMTYVPGTKGYLTFRYSTEEENWRTKVLFNYKVEEIKKLSVEYFEAPQNSFIVTQVAADSFALAPADAKFQINDSYQQNFIRQYLEFYSSIYIEGFENNYSGKDSLLQTTPYCKFTITENDNSVNKVSLYRMPLSKRSKLQFDAQGNDMPFDIDHYYASIHEGKDFALVQYYIFGKLLRNYKDFYFKPTK